MEKLRRERDCGARPKGTGAAPNEREPKNSPGPASSTKASVRVLDAAGRSLLDRDLR